MLEVSLQKLCFDYTVQNLGAFPPAVLSLLPLTIRQEMLPLMCVADVYRVEASGFTKDMDTSDLWKGFYKKYYNEASNFFPNKRDVSDIDWKEDFSTALGYHALHHYYRTKTRYGYTCMSKVLNRPLAEVLFGSSSPYIGCQLDVSSVSYIDQLMEVFDYMQFRCKKLVLYESFLHVGVRRGLAQHYIAAKVQGKECGNCKITKLTNCLEVICGEDFDEAPILETFSNADLEYIIQFHGTTGNKVIPLMKQPCFKSIFVSNDYIEFGELRKLIDCFLLNVAEHKQTFSLHVKDVTSIIISFTQVEMQ